MLSFDTMQRYVRPIQIVFLSDFRDLSRNVEGMGKALIGTPTTEMKPNKSPEGTASAWN